MESMKEGWGIFVKINGKEQLVGLVSKRKNARNICKKKNKDGRGPRFYTYQVHIKENMNEQDGVQAGPTTEETEEPIREEGIDVGPSTGKEEESSVPRDTTAQADKAGTEVSGEGYSPRPPFEIYDEASLCTPEQLKEFGRFRDTTIRFGTVYASWDRGPDGYAGFNTHEANTDKS